MGDDAHLYFRDFLLPLFHQALGTPPTEQAWDDPDVCRIIGQVPYVNGGIFECHDLERDYEIDIPNSAFDSLFDFFDQWRWQLDERPTGDHNEINPDILGFIFEQYVNYTGKGRKEQGAYYTKPDVTGYMSVSAIILAVVDRLVEHGLPDPCVLLPNTGDRYLHSVLGYGREVGLPDGDLGPSALPDPALDIALPGERWCDVTHRRDRYDELVALVDGGGVGNINDAVTANLDLVGLMEDYLSQMLADECEIAFEVLRSLTVCDPTCGSGAFLLSALDVLEPMYTILLDRGQEIEASVNAGPMGWQDVPQFVWEPKNHPNDRYWLLKTICLNNLYGVDLMGEAVEIAKLRLFLKLVAQLDDATRIEPLPDLDFNIKSGNLLVGIADTDDAERRFSDNLLQVLGIKAAEQAAKKAADAYERFVKDQIADSGTGAVAGKQRLTAQIRGATEQADVALYDMRGEQSGLEAWRQSHVPFHWFAEFPSVWRHGGFDVIIGNPPYINKKQVTQYTWRGYWTEKCPDLYAVCVERASTLLNEHGHMAMVVMHNLCFGERFEPLRKYLSDRFRILWTSSYDRWSDSLFHGSVKGRNTILVASRKGHPGHYGSRLFRWLVNQRPYLFNLLEYLSLDPTLKALQERVVWPFIDEASLQSAFVELREREDKLETHISKDAETISTLGYRDTADDQLPCWITPPQSFDSKGTLATPKSDQTLAFGSAFVRDAAYLFFAGRWGYLWWLTFGDGFHVTKTIVMSFPSAVSAITSADIQDRDRLGALASDLALESGRYVTFSRRGPKKRQWLIGSYDLHRCRHITDEADWLLAKVWGLTRAQYEAAGNLRDRMTFGQK